MKAVKGNYTAYFQRRGGSEDAERRLNLLPVDKLANKVILDIGTYPTLVMLFLIIENLLLLLHRLQQWRIYHVNCQKV